MPTYEYECTKCGGRLEKFQSMTEKPLKKCPTCATATLKRLIGAGAGIIFKGSGFYQTDYRSESYKKRQKEETCPNPGAGSGCASGKPCQAG
jgi:putative FmdB family regulatory protein